MCSPHFSISSIWTPITFFSYVSDSHNHSVVHACMLTYLEYVRLAEVNKGCCSYFALITYVS